SFSARRSRRSRPRTPRTVVKRRSTRSSWSALARRWRSRKPRPMRGASRAIGWELTRHHRFGLIVLVSYVIAFWVVKRLVFPEAVLRFNPPTELAGFFLAPLTIAFCFFVGAFS